MSTVLLTGAALSARGLAYAAQADYYTDPYKSVALATTEVTPGAKMVYQTAVLDRLRRVNGIVAVGSTTNIPLGVAPRRRFRIIQEQDASEVLEAAINFVSVGYFRALSVPVVAGRAFSFSEDTPAERNVVVNEAFVHQFLGREAVGRTLEDAKGTKLQVVGVVRNEIYRVLQGQPAPTVYYPSSHSGTGRGHLVIRANRDAEAYLSVLRRELSAIPDSRFVEIRPFESHLTNVLLQERIGALLVSLCGLSTLALTLFGVHAVAANTVRHRSREFAVRLTLGARPTDLLRNLAGATLIPIVAGALLGLAISLLTLHVARWITFLPAVGFGVIAGTGGLVVGVALISAMVPLRYLRQMNPWVVLRSE
jgi:putative ABC transport system permease protein